MRRRLPTHDEVRTTYEHLAQHHNDAHCELVHENAFQLLAATVLSAQTTDVAVNKATPTLFARFPTPEAMAAAEEGAIEACVASIGMYRQKARHLRGLATMLVRDHGGAVPQTLAELIRLPGVGRKTANVVLGVAFRKSEGVVVDTHVQRISQRLGWTRAEDPIRIEQDLMRLLPRPDWSQVSHVLIFHGRRICGAQRPLCETCPVAAECPSAFKAVLVGRKPKKVRKRVESASKSALPSEPKPKRVTGSATPKSRKKRATRRASGGARVSK